MARNEWESHECHASDLGSRAALLTPRGAQYVAELVSAQTVGQGANRMGRTSVKFVPEMEDEGGQNPIQTVGICEARDTDDCSEANAASAIHRFRRAVEEAHPAGSPALRGTQWQAQRGVCLE